MAVIPCNKCAYPLDEKHINQCAVGDIPLHFSAYYGHEECLRAWVEAGADVNKASEKHRTPLMMASQYGRAGCVQVLIAAGADVNVTTTYKDTPLIMAADRGHDECVELLIKAGADVNHSPKKYKNPLERAVTAKSKRSAELLLDAGADVNLIVPIGLSTILKSLVSKEHAARVKAILKQEASENDWMYTAETCVLGLARERNAEGLEIAIQAGADVDSYEEGTALMIACEQGDAECTEILLTAGANVNMGDDDENTPLIKASVNGSHQCVELLVNAGADVNCVNEKGYAAIDRAAQLGFDECVNWLIKGGADLNRENWSHYTPLFVAAFHSSHKCLDLMIKAGSDVNKVTEPDKHTALHAAVYNDHSQAIEASQEVDGPFVPENHSHPKCVDLLIKAGAGVNATEYWGNTPLIFAAKNCHLGCVKLLLKAGAYVNIRSTCSRKRNALDNYFNEAMWTSKPLVVLLYAAGESSENEKIQNYVNVNEYGETLKGACREAIRRHLIGLDAHSNLFTRVPRLGLPSQLREYLLYNATLQDQGLFGDDLFRSGIGRSDR